MPSLYFSSRTGRFVGVLYLTQLNCFTHAHIQLHMELSWQRRINFVLDVIFKINLLCKQVKSQQGHKEVSNKLLCKNRKRKFWIDIWHSSRGGWTQFAKCHGSTDRFQFQRIFALHGPQRLQISTTRSRKSPRWGLIILCLHLYD